MLTDILAGRKTVGTITGSVLFAGHKPGVQFLRRYSAYVEQFGEHTLVFFPWLLSNASNSALEIFQGFVPSQERELAQSPIAKGI